MKVGDLVRLSAYGKQRKRAIWIDRDDVGIIVRVRSWGSSGEDYRVKWVRSDYNERRGTAGYGSYWNWEEYNQRKDLMYAK